MKTVILSSKYQVVIPKEIRESLNLKPGQKLHVQKGKNGAVEIQTKSALDELYGSVPGVWGDDAVAYIRKQRDDWEG